MAPLTLAQDACHEEIVRKSRFIALAFRVDSEADFQERLAAIRRDYPGANHYVYGYVIREAGGRLCIRFSDDGEPKNSSGRPTLAPIQGRELTNAAVVVVRYFGGIKLGVGGLVRAYGGAASAALDSAGVHPLVHRVRHTLDVAYENLQQTERKLAAEGAVIVDRTFAGNVTLVYEVEEEGLA